MTKDPLSIIKEFPHLRVLVVGDIMLDEYIEGTAERISPEAPIPVLLQKNVRHCLGGAANVAANVASLGGMVTLVGHIGSGERATVIKKLCKSARIDARFVTESGRSTTTKMRFVSDHHQLVRIDIEESKQLDKKTVQQLVKLLEHIPDQDVVIVSDYAKGVIGPEVIALLKKRFGAKKILADMKPQNAALYRGIRAITPNVKEALELTHIHVKDDRTAAQAAQQIAHDLKTTVVLTRGADGVTLREYGKQCVHIKSAVRDVRDVTGAGDTLISTFALSLAAGASVQDAVEIANTAAGIVVSSPGTVALSSHQLIAQSSAVK